MRIRFLKATVLIGTIVVAPTLLAQGGGQGTAARPGTANPATAKPAPKRDITGIWNRQAGDPSLSSIHSLSGVARGPGYVDMPPMTPEGQKRFEANRPGYGIRQQPMGNDPNLRCMPTGMPRLVWGGGEFAQLPGKMVQFMGSTWRQIATDGRPLRVEEPELRYDSGWMGSSVGRWENDDTFVVESAGFNGQSWLSEEGLPFSDEMKMTERYKRVDFDTLTLDATIDDPKTYTQLYKVITVTFERGPDRVRVATFCNPDNEKLFEERIRSQAIKPPDGGAK
jgi:hypothetical protein